MKEQEGKIWKEGFEAGIKSAMRENDEAIKIGRMIISVLDERYEFKEEDY